MILLKWFMLFILYQCKKKGNYYYYYFLMRIVEKFELQVANYCNIICLFGVPEHNGR